MVHYRINGIRTAIDEPPENVIRKTARKLRIREDAISHHEIRRRSIDARDKSDVHFVYTVDVFVPEAIRIPSRIAGSVKVVDDEAEAEKDPICGNEPMSGRPVIAGFGPCGIFAALELARMGYRPLVIERGPAMDERVSAVDDFRKNRVLDPEANMLFGEGGAGTFSDGKLTSGIKSGHIRYVLQQFADAGAGEDILYLNKPHIGTDVLREVIVRLRERITSLGGEIRFGTKLESLETDGERLTGIVTVNSEGGRETIPTNALILAVGHSARDTFEMINDAGMKMQQKPFSIGVRMEHPQEMIDASQYGEEAVAKYGELLPPAEYRLAYREPGGRGVYSFCMCPGGEVVVCSNADGELCVNGMSNRRRDSGTANSAILCDLKIEDYNNGDENDVLAGVRFQQKYERLAFENGGGDFTAPSCTMEEFMSGSGAAAKAVEGSLPEFATEAIRQAVPVFGRTIKGYDRPDAVVTAVETRSSSPVRIVRGDDGQSSIAGVYPAGEGAGYAGGITSAACDGIRTAHLIIERFAAGQDI